MRATLLSCLTVLICFIISSFLNLSPLHRTSLLPTGLFRLFRGPYTTASTVVATVLAAFVVSQVIMASLCHVDDHFSPELLSGQAQLTSLLTLASSWQVILGLSSIRDSFKL